MIHLTLQSDFTKPTTRAKPNPAQTGEGMKEGTEEPTPQRLTTNHNTTPQKQGSQRPQAQPYFESDKTLPPEDPEPVNHHIRRTVDILNLIEVSFQSHEKFKLMCNNLYKWAKYYIQDPKNPINQAVPIRFEDLENNEGIYCQLACLCQDYDLVVEVLEKGVFIKGTRSDVTFLEKLSSLLEGFKKHKDESVTQKSVETKEQTKIKGTSVNDVDPNRAERVAAFFEAKRLRAIVDNHAASAFFPEGNQNGGQFEGLPQPVPISPMHPQFNCPSPHGWSNHVDPNAQHMYTNYPAPPQSPHQPNAQTPANNPIAPRPAQQQIPAQDNRDPLARRFDYKVDDAHIQRNPGQGNLSHQAQLNEYRNKVRNNNHHQIDSRGGFMTWEQLENKIDLEDQEVLGKKCLEHTNEFRKSQGLPPLAWEPLLFNIGKSSSYSALIHSKDMGHKRVPFGHQGFDDRCRQMPFCKQSAGENVAFIGGVEKNRQPKVLLELIKGCCQRLDRESRA